jgi:hypothetical protein
LAGLVEFLSDGEDDVDFALDHVFE